MSVYTQLPVIDFSACALREAVCETEELNLHSEIVRKIAEDIVRGFDKFGAVYLVNHGMDPEKVSFEGTSSIWIFHRYLYRLITKSMSCASLVASALPTRETIECR